MMTTFDNKAEPSAATSKARAKAGQRPPVDSLQSIDANILQLLQKVQTIVKGAPDDFAAAGSRSR